MTLTDKYRVAVQNGKIVQKDLIARDGWLMDSIAEIKLGQQREKIVMSERYPSRMIIIPDYIDVKKEGVVFKNGKIVSQEKNHTDQTAELSDELKAKAPKRRASRPGDEDQP